MAKSLKREEEKKEVVRFVYNFQYRDTEAQRTQRKYKDDLANKKGVHPYTLYYNIE